MKSSIKNHRCQYLPLFAVVCTPLPLRIDFILQLSTCPTMSSQQQDLVFFSDNSIISNESLVPGNKNLHIISHNAGTNPSWLLTSIVENGLLGTANLVNRELNRKISNRALVTVASFVHPREFWVLACRKQGVDLDSNTHFNYVDCVSDLFTKHVTNPASSKAGVCKLFDNITTSVEKQNNDKKIIIVESPETLLAATDLTSNDLVHLLRKLASAGNTLIVVVNSDSPLTGFAGSLPGDPVFKITDFYVKLHHVSSLNINILPLATGRAKDITGCLTVSKGAKPANPVTQVVEKDYIFHISKESVKLYFR